MKRAPAAVLLGAVALAGCASSGSKPHASTRAEGPRTPVAQVQAEVHVPRVSHARFTRILPRLRGARPCTILVIERLRESKPAATCRRKRLWYPTATDGVAGAVQLTREVPCPGSKPRVGPAELRKLRAIAAVMCTDGFRNFRGQGQWEVFLRKVAVRGVAAEQRYFEQPSRPKWPPKNAVCAAYLSVITPIAFVDARGHWRVPRTPVDRCNHPLGLPKGERPLRMRWHVVRMHRIRQVVSAAAVAADCPMRWGNSVAWAGPPRDSTGGPLFPVAPKTVHVCIFRTPPNHFAVGRFIGGFRLDKLRTRRLLGALTGAGPRRGCPKQRTFAVVIKSPGSVASVELGGCWRVDRADRLAGTARPAVVRAILGVG